jgi:hypothetical protein
MIDRILFGAGWLPPVLSRLRQPRDAHGVALGLGLARRGAKASGTTQTQR